MNDLAASALAHGRRSPKPEVKKPESPKTGKSKSKVREIHVRRAKGGFIAKHVSDYDPEATVKQDEEHILPDMQALHDHMDEHFGGEPAAPVNDTDNDQQ